MNLITMGSKPKMPAAPKPPKPVAPQAQLVDLDADTESGASNFEADLKKKRKRAQTQFAGETGGYGGNTNLG